MVLDILGMTEVNRVYGWETGDQRIRSRARLLQESKRYYDSVEKDFRSEVLIFRLTRDDGSLYLPVCPDTAD